ncbi:MAG: AAA family ATPase [Clostridium sp.]|nr:AAA family ATPase [Clostridium sp.]
MLLEGARRVGKSTIAENFAKNEYKSYILIDFSKTTSNILECFDDIGNLNIFFLRLQAETGITLYEHESLIIFDEVQLFPKARQATNRKLMRDLRIYMAVGGMPQAVEAYVNGKNFSEIDMIKRQMCLFVTK